MTEPLRVLDCGANDGWLGAWLKARYDGPLVIDGIELNAQAVTAARRRGYGKVAKGRIEDAPTLLEPGSYDVVVLFEVLEHVPDMGALLGACERMLKPDGRVFVSTPEGTFGEGSNPNHLRALRAIDLADILRRRGSLEGFAVGTDGVSVAAYTPAARRGEIAIFCGPTHPWAPHDIETKGLGGSETAAVRLAEALARAGYVVNVYGEVDEGCVADVLYRNWRAFDPAERRLAVIASRMPEAFERPINAQFKGLWLHDTDVSERLTGKLADRIDRVLTLSEWHTRHVEGMYPFLQATPGRPSKVVETRNGVNLDYFKGAPVERKPRLLYTSSPDRGLDVLLEEWHRIRSAAPEAVFSYAYPGYFDQAADQVPALAEFRDRIRELADQPGVEPLGPLSQPGLASLMRESLVWAAPSYCTPVGTLFHETSCIGAMEAQAAGLLCVASHWGALPETIRVGRTVGGAPPGQRWRDSLVREIVDGLTNPETQAWAQTEGPKAAADLGWDPVAEQIAALIEGEVIA